MKRRIFIGAGVVACLLAAFVFWRLLDHDLGWRNSAAFQFRTLEGEVSGTLWLPDDAPLAAIVLVHGDGPQDRTSNGGYAPLINTFLDRGIAVAAWDKPGIGASAGDWLMQSMADRAMETRVALAELDLRFENLPVGAMGFSQAGWVLPQLEPEVADFLVLIGPAVSWQAQGEYYTRTRLAREGRGTAEIEQRLRDEAKQDEILFSADRPPADLPVGMTPARWRFIRINRTVDASADLAAQSLPVLAIWGAKDLNVDAQADAATYRDLLADRAAGTQIQLWPEATHGLLRAGPYNYQLVDEWPWHAKLRFFFEGRHAFAPGALDMISDWILAPSEDDP
ncbi:alpha/beta hydrolase [Tritonibacter mobilis]|uniref:alpha/beta hydrolase n=1 Tax=Tritonibacter mobilis TaxID=379347 RepID=UPI0039A6CF7D